MNHEIFLLNNTALYKLYFHLADELISIVCKNITITNGKKVKLPCYDICVQFFKGIYQYPFIISADCMLIRKSHKGIWSVVMRYPTQKSLYSFKNTSSEAKRLHNVFKQIESNIIFYKQS